MTDDADLRARIEARVAARRAASEASETGDPTADETDGATADETDRPAADEADGADEAAAVRRPRRPASLAPVRPWRRAQERPDDDVPGPSANGSEDSPRGGRLRPARPWRAAAEGERARAAKDAPGPAPSHPDIVLRGIAGGDDTPAAPTKKWAGSRVTRLFRRRRHGGKDEDDGDERFALPAPSPAFDESWLRAGRPPPHPTRDWSQAAGPPLSAPQPIAGSAPEAEPEAEAATSADAEAESAAVDLVKRHASPRPPRPPGAPATERPSPGPRQATRRPRPAPAAAAPDVPAARPSQTLPDDKAPDLSRFRKATVAAPAEDKEHEERKPKSRWRGTLVRTAVILVIAALAALLLRVFVVQPYYIPSASMEPTLHGCKGCNDDHVLVDKISYRIHGPKAGDIVVFHRPKAANPSQVPESVLIKRVIAVGGDKIAIRKGRVYVNTLVLDEPYLNKNHSCYPNMNMARRTVPKNDVFVMGDNRCDSIDSRTFGPVRTSSIIGRAFAIIWPLNRIRLLH